jgi:hypothetical protein
VAAVAAMERRGGTGRQSSGGGVWVWWARRRAKCSGRACVSEDSEGEVAGRAVRTEEDLPNAWQRLSPCKFRGYSQVVADSGRQRERWRTGQWPGPRHARKATRMSEGNSHTVIDGDGEAHGCVSRKPVRDA